MSRLGGCFENRKVEGKTALIVYLVAGDPDRNTTVPLMHAMVKAGADIIELGVPFTDPEADGPVIQTAVERALDQGMNLSCVLELVSEFRVDDTRTPVMLMGYANPIEVMGYPEFAVRASKSGVDGTILVNLPPEEAANLNRELANVNIDPVYLLAPTTTEARAHKICSASRGFVYYVSLKGVTGAASLDVGDVREKLAVFRGLTDLPIAVGFGIKDGETAASVATFAEGVVVGSALVKLIGEPGVSSDEMTAKVCRLVTEMRQAMDKATTPAIFKSG
jgi:tryptophan synthase alpha chain